MASLQGKTWSAPIGAILSDVLKRRRRLPKPPFSFLFLVILYTCIGWSGLTYVTLNGPKLFEVKTKQGSRKLSQKIHFPGKVHFFGKGVKNYCFFGTEYTFPEEDTNISSGKHLHSSQKPTRILMRWMSKRLS